MKFDIMKAIKAVGKQTNNGIDILKTAVLSHDTSIMTATGIAGFIFSEYKLVKNTPQAVSYIQERELELGRELSFLEKVDCCWRCYIFPVGMSIASAGFIIASDKISDNRKAALTVAYTAAEKALNDYQESTKEVVGEKKESKIRENIASKDLEVPNEEFVNSTGHGNVLFKLGRFGGYFRANMDFVKLGISRIQNKINSDDYAGVADLQDEFGLEDSELTCELGWHKSQFGGNRFENAVTFSWVDNGVEPVCTIEFYNCMPEPGFDY